LADDGREPHTSGEALTVPLVKPVRSMAPERWYRNRGLIFEGGKIMIRYWTADPHFNHGAIAIYCQRPYVKKGEVEDGKFVSREASLACAERMNRGIIQRCNSRVKPHDTVINVGDFMTKGVAKGVEGLRVKPEELLASLNGTWILTEGNHDRQNGVKCPVKHFFTKIGHYKVFVSHYPVENSDAFDKDLLNYVIKSTDFQCCGHVHNAWRYKFLKTEGRKPYLMYNVGLDVQKYMPVSDAEIIADVVKINRREIKGLT